MSFPRIKEGGFILPSPDMIVAALIVGLSISNLLFINLYRSTTNEYADYRANVESQANALRAEAERVRAESEQVSKDTANGWAAAVYYWRSRSPIRVRDNCGAGTVSGLSASSAGTFVGPLQPGFGAPRDVTAQECETRLNGAVFDAAQLMHLQAWAIKQSEIKP